MAGAFLSGRMAGRVKPTHQIRYGFVIMAVVSVRQPRAQPAVRAAAWWALLPIALYAFGWALMVPVVTLMVLDLVPERRGMASSLQAFVGSAANGLVAGVIAPLVMHSTLALAVTSLGMLRIGVVAWLWVKPHVRDRRAGRRAWRPERAGRVSPPREPRHNRPDDSSLVLGLVALSRHPLASPSSRRGWRERDRSRGSARSRGRACTRSPSADRPRRSSSSATALARREPVVLYTPPAALRHLALLLMLPVFPLLLAAYLPGRIQARGEASDAARRPSSGPSAHLLANGTLADVLLFGGFLAWAVADRISVKRRAGVRTRSRRRRRGRRTT